MKLWNIYTKRGFRIVRFLIEAETFEDAIHEVFDYKFNRSGEYERKALIEGRIEIYGNNLTPWSEYWFGEHKTKIYRAEFYTSVPFWCKKFDYSELVKERMKEAEEQ
ncbi:MAG: hypothetical protein ACTSPB_15565 [Candidatus Thorarchaeota archaeon]